MLLCYYSSYLGHWTVEVSTPYESQCSANIDSRYDSAYLPAVGLLPNSAVVVPVTNKINIHEVCMPFVQTDRFVKSISVHALADLKFRNFSNFSHQP
jgi:hypothetical protein